MRNKGDIIVIEDDPDDRDLLMNAYDALAAEKNYSNKLVLLEDSTTVVDYLKTYKAKPFIIISDINMPKIDGFALRDLIFNDPALSRFCVPYVFLTTTDNPKYVQDAYKLSVQGYFIKPTGFRDYVNMLDRIMRYWEKSAAPDFVAN